VPKGCGRPLRSPASSAGKTAAPPVRAARVGCAATEPGLFGREDPAVIPQMRSCCTGRYGARPLRPGRHLVGGLSTGALPVAATEPGLFGREDARPARCPRRWGRCRYGARPLRPGRRVCPRRRCRSG